MPTRPIRRPQRCKDHWTMWLHVQREDDCWTWVGCRDGCGYGRITRWGVHYPVHRLAWELLCGPIPDGLTIDHLCRNRACVNPDHLEPVTLRTNVLRGNGMAARNARKTHCIHGHAFIGDNIRWRRRNGIPVRACIRCEQIREKRRWKEYKEAQ